MVLVGENSALVEKLVAQRLSFVLWQPIAIVDLSDQRWC